ncbi:hypothetical protein KLJ75_18380, partial [Clostridioides difficile]|nr:hypothetical protein [Clostridioides difficile]
GGSAQCVVIENDFKEELHESVQPKGQLEDLSKEDIVGIIKEASPNTTPAVAILAFLTFSALCLAFLLSSIFFVRFMFNRSLL